MTITSASKAWNLAGLKCAVLVPGSGTAAMLATLPGAFATTRAISACSPRSPRSSRGDDWLDELLAYLDGTGGCCASCSPRTFPTSATCSREAGYLAWLDCRALSLGDDPAAAFLERGRVALSSGPTSASRAAGSRA